jgi:hypothetical protein
MDPEYWVIWSFEHDGWCPRIGSRRVDGEVL